MILEHEIKSFLQAMKNKGASAAHFKRRRFALNLLREAFAGRELGSIEPWEVHNFLSNVRKCDGSRYSAASLAGISEALKTFFKWSQKKGLISKAAYKKIKNLEKHKYTTDRDRAVPAAELVQVLNCLEDFATAGSDRNLRDALVISLCCDSGARIGGVHNIERAAVEKALAAPRLVNGWRVYEVPTIEKGKERLLVFYDASADLMRRWLAIAPAAAVFVFCSLQTGDLLNRRTVTAAFDHICEFAGVTVFYSHAVRRRVLRDIRDLGHASDAQAIAGHSHIETTIKHYLNDGRDHALGVAAEAAARRRGLDPLAAAFFMSVDR